MKFATLRSGPWIPAFAGMTLLLTAISAPAVFAQAPQVELIPRATFFGNPTKAQGLISPDGKWISWIAPRDGVLNIWVAPASDPSKAKPLTEEKVRPIRQHFWARNSKSILFINDRGGDENYLLYGVSPEGGALKSYTPFQKTRVIPIATSRKRTDEILIGLNNRNPQWHDVYLLNTATGELKLVYQNDQYGSFEADDDLKLRLAFKESPGGGQDVFRFNDGKVEPFSKVPAEDSITTASNNISADGKTLFWIDSRGRDKAALVAQDLSSGATRVIAESGRADISGVMLNPVTLVPEAFSVNYLRKEWTPVSDAVKADFDALNAQVKGQWEVVSRDDADSKWILYTDEVTKPVAYSIYDRKTRKVSPLFVTRPELEGKPLAPPKAQSIVFGVLADEHVDLDPRGPVNDVELAAMGDRLARRALADVEFRGGESLQEGAERRRGQPDHHVHILREPWFAIVDRRVRANDHVLDREALETVHEVPQQLGLGHRLSLFATSCRMSSGSQSGCFARTNAASRSRASSQASCASRKRSIPDLPRRILATSGSRRSMRTAWAGVRFSVIRDALP